jgi:ABC-type transporter lipoprotein component MlaA
VLEDVREVRSASLDFYASVRSAWMERRRALVADRDSDSEPAEDLYNFEDDAP